VRSWRCSIAGSRVTYAYWVHFFEPRCRALPIRIKPIREQDFLNSTCHMLPSDRSTFPAPSSSIHTSAILHSPRATSVSRWQYIARNPSFGDSQNLFQDNFRVADALPRASSFRLRVASEPDDRMSVLTICPAWQSDCSKSHFGTTSSLSSYIF
jgi:hypothetical protein